MFYILFNEYKEYTSINSNIATIAAKHVITPRTTAPSAISF